LNRSAKARVDLAEVFRLADSHDLARHELETARSLYELKGNLVQVGRLQALLGVATAV
jgi:hypothetical protein